MKRIVVYYSLSGNTEEAAIKIAKMLDCDIAKVTTKKAMPKAFVGQILVGGGQVAMGIVPEINALDKDMSLYDEIIVGTPIWNSKNVPAITAFWKDEDVRKKTVGVFTFSGGGSLDKANAIFKETLPKLKATAELLDRKQETSKDNEAKIAKFVEEINRG